MGLTFNYETFTNLYQCYKNFKNSVFIVYDISKSNYGLNPLHAYRFSEKAVNSLEKNPLTATITDKFNLVQDKIRSQNLSISEFFEEIPIRVYRSHLLQAFLFDHIQPHIPAFNAQILKMANSNYLCNHVYELNEVTEELIFE